MRKFLGICIIALAIAITATCVYAEVQNIKVSGDITTRAFARKGFADTDTFIKTCGSSSSFGWCHFFNYHHST